MAEGIMETWLVVHPKSLLNALETVESGEISALDMMMFILDTARESMEEETEDE